MLSNTLWYRTSLWGMVEQGMEPYFAVALDRIPFDREIGDGKSILRLITDYD